MGSGRTLLTFIVFALALTTTSALSECFESGLVPGVGCDPTPNICEIACPSEGNCELVGDGCTDDTEISEAEMTKDKCQDMCQASNSTVEDNHCRFWRWEVQSNNKKKCYLMNSEGHQCKNPKACEPSDCYHGDVGCANGEKPGTACPASMDFNSDPGFIHWGCVKEGVDNLPSPYDQNEPNMPAGTICTTAHRCVDYDANSLTNSDALWRKMSVKCNGNNGQWEQVQGADGRAEDYTKVLPTVDSKIVEQMCVGGNTTTLEVNLASDGNGVGAALVCDEDATSSGGTTYTITAPNHCLLLCDLHIGMTIDGRLDADGVYEWVDQDGEAITAAEGDNPVECWAGRRL